MQAWAGVMHPKSASVMNSSFVIGLADLAVHTWLIHAVLSSSTAQGPGPEQHCLRHYCLQSCEALTLMHVPRQGLSTAGSSMEQSRCACKCSA